MKNYETEARSRWGDTDAYHEHEQKTKNYTKEKWAEANDGLMAIFAEFASCKGSGASADFAEVNTLAATKAFVEDIIDDTPGLELEYYNIVDGNTLQEVKEWSDSEYIVGCIALFCGKIRLIDNIKYKGGE